MTLVKSYCASLHAEFFEESESSFEDGDADMPEDLFICSKSFSGDDGISSELDALIEGNDRAERAFINPAATSKPYEKPSKNAILQCDNSIVAQPSSVHYFNKPSKHLTKVVAICPQPRRRSIGNSAA